MARRPALLVPALPPLLVVLGPTASGKSPLAMSLAESLGGEIVSADSMQVYRGLDVGTAKPTPDERARVPHHLVDVLDPGETFSAADFRRRAIEAARAIAARGRVPLVVGGTGLYLRALLHGIVPAPSADPELRAAYRRVEDEGGPGTLHRRLAQVDPAAAARLHPHDLVRIERALEVHHLVGRPLSDLQAEHSFAAGDVVALRLRLDVPREVLNDRIDARAARMVASGWVEEVRSLIRSGVDPDGRALQGLGYRRVVERVRGETDEAEMLRRVRADTRTYARRQIAWFRGEREAVAVPPPPEGTRWALERARRFLHDPPVAGAGSATPPAPGAP